MPGTPPRKVVTIKESSNGVRGSSSERRTGQTSLERKLELLEQRFYATSTPPRRKNTLTSPSETSVATLDGLTSPQQQQHSQHSFTFDPPKTARLAGVGSRENSLASRSPLSFSAVELAASKHMAKVLQAQDNSAQATLLTDNKAQPADVVVKESPAEEETAAQKTIKKRKSFIPTRRSAATVVESSTLSSSGSNSNGPKAAAPKRKRQAENKPVRAASPPSKRAIFRQDRSLLEFFSSSSKTAPSDPSGPTDKSIRGDKENTVATNQNHSINKSPDEESLEFYRSKCQELELQTQEQQAQLAAIANNRTMLQSALQVRWKQAQEKLVTLRTEHDAERSKIQDLVEVWIREKATLEAKELREQLAVSPLGRMVYKSTGGMRQRVVEHWEEGPATEEWNRKRQKLQSRKEELLQRAAAAEAAVKDFRSKKADNDSSGTISNLLDAQEAVESVRYHLECHKQAERELALEERRLKDEKVAHIRKLKRVASEDASRFRSRPKLNDRYVLQHLLGKGGFSEVWRAFDLDELREVAVKIHQLDPRWSESKKENYTKHVSREYEIHRSVRHARIVSLYDVFEIDNNSFATVLECCSGRDLDMLLKQKGSLEEREARAILLQILSGMRYLSQPDGTRQGIIHYDLKPGNILFDEVGDAKITDFGLSKIVEAHDSGESMELTSQGAGTYWYLPPECFLMEDSVRISNKVDVWSIGVIFYQMLFGKRPFGHGITQDKILADQTMLNAHQVEFPDRVSVTSSCKQFLLAALTYDQAFRPTVSQLCEHVYVTEQPFK